MGSSLRSASAGRITNDTYSVDFLRGEILFIRLKFWIDVGFLRPWLFPHYYADYEYADRRDVRGLVCWFQPEQSLFRLTRAINAATRISCSAGSARPPQRMSSIDPSFMHLWARQCNVDMLPRIVLALSRTLYPFYCTEE